MPDHRGPLPGLSQLLEIRSGVPPGLNHCSGLDESGSLRPTQMSLAVGLQALEEEAMLLDGPPPSVLHLISGVVNSSHLVVGGGQVRGERE